MAGSLDDFRELLRALNEEEVEYLIIGGHAVMRYTEPRYTKDLDIWVRNSPENAVRVYLALAKYGAPVDEDGITPFSFQDENLFYLLGREPVRVDVIGGISGVKFETAWPNRVKDEYLGVPVCFVSLDDLVANKRASGRKSDLEQLRFLKKKLDKIPAKKKRGRSAD